MSQSQRQLEERQMRKERILAGALKVFKDNGLDGAEIDLNGEYRTTTNDNNMYFLGGTGEIYLNTEETTEPLVRGETLKGLMAILLHLLY